MEHENFKFQISNCFVLVLVPAAWAVTPIKDIDVTGANAKISSGTFSIQTGVIFQALAGSTVKLEAATVTIGTLTTAGNANAVIDPAGTGSIQLLSNIYAGSAATTPTALLQLKAGSATAATAPLKLTSGTVLTTPEAGALEYDGAFFYGTNSTPTRQRIATDANAAAIAALDIDWRLSAVHSKTLGANTTFTFSNADDGKTIVVAVTNTASNYTVTWPAVSWSGGTAPVQTVGAKTDVYTFVKIGATIYGSVVQNF